MQAPTTHQGGADGRILTLREAMEKFDAALWFQVSARFTRMEAMPDAPTFATLSAQDKATVRREFAAGLEGWQETFLNVADRLVKMGCHSSAASARRVAAAGARIDDFDPNRLRDAVTQLRDRLDDDLALPMFFVLTPPEGELYSSGAPFGEEVMANFFSSAYDVEEATKCLALGRTTACVFHLMRVMEIGLAALGARLGVTTTHKPGWENILRKAHGQMSLPNDKKDPSWIKDETFLSDAIAMLIAVETAWRNPTMHMERIYTDEQAKRIWESVRGFMQQLATGLHD